MVVASALICLALNVYHEARGEPWIGQVAVARVTMNRANHNTSRVCETVAKKGQFSWTRDLLYKHGKRFHLASRGIPTEGAAWKQSLQIAAIALRESGRDPSKGAMFYHCVTVRPSWSGNMKIVAVWGKHIFYKA